MALLLEGLGVGIGLNDFHKSSLPELAMAAVLALRTHSRMFK